jgi:hypothetical protein
MFFLKNNYSIQGFSVAACVVFIWVSLVVAAKIYLIKTNLIIII